VVTLKIVGLLRNKKTAAAAPPPAAATVITGTISAFSFDFKTQPV